MIWHSMVLCFLVMFSTAASSSVFVRWTQPDLPLARDLGISDLVVSWDRGTSSFVQAAHSQGYRVYAEVTLQQAATAADSAEQHGLAGLVLDVADSDRAAGESAFQQLRSAHPNVRFLVVTRGKQPQMRGSLVIKRGSVLEVSSPTAQPWIDTNLALIRVQRRSYPGQLPLYSFSWNGSKNGSENGPNPGQQQLITPTDYSLAVAEACSFQADLILELEDGMQRALAEQDPKAKIFWKQVRSYVDFCAQAGEQELEAAANVAVVVDDLDTSDEVMNLLARHNIPFKVFLPSDLKVENFEAFDVVVVFAKRDRTTYRRIGNLADHGKTVVVVDAHGPYPWQTHEPVRLNKHTVSYAVGKGKVLELSEAVSDPETFAQDIRRLLGKQNALLSLWNGLTTIALPYRVQGGTLKVLNLINYAAEPVRVHVQLKGSYSAIRYETPGQECCKSLVPVKHDGFTEFVIPDLMIAGRVHLEAEQAADAKAGRRSH
jgi:protein-tyrosine-phosphatase